jgi:Flp pilus assembly protein TadG
VVAAAMVVVLLTVTGGVAQLGAAVVARHRAQAAADLAALAALAGCPPEPTRLARKPTRWPARCGPERRAVSSTSWIS